MKYKPRPDALASRTYQLPLHGEVFIVLGKRKRDKQAFEVFCYGTALDSHLRATLEGLTRMVSLALRYNIPQREIVEQLSGIQCCTAFIGNGQKILSIPDAIGQVLNGKIE